jgi:hypothetical protein
VRQPTVDRSLDEIECKKGKRDCYIDLSHAAPLLRMIPDRVLASLAIVPERNAG